MFFIMGITFISLIVKIQTFFIQGNYLLLTITLVMTSLIIWMIIEGIISIKNRLI